MRRYHIIVMLLLLVVIVVLGAILVPTITKNREASGMIVELQAQLEELGNQQQGGAETAPPEPPRSTSEYRFPVAESDYIMYTSSFGYRVSPILNVELYHQGVDIAAVGDAQIVAIADGTVVEHWPPPDGYFRGHDIYGGMVIIRHDNGWKSLYAHMSWTRVNTGDRVQSGEVIGRIGSTGKSRGIHLHIELMDGAGRNVNPVLYFEPKEPEND